MCKTAGVSKSGYYAWIKAKPLRENREISDSLDFIMVKEAYEYKTWKKGAR